MKITHLTTVHNVLDVRIFHKQCISLANRGHQVTLIAPTESDSIVDGIQIISIPKSTSRLQRIFISTVVIYKKAMTSKAKIYHFHDPDLILVGMLLRLKGAKVIYDVHEDYPRQMMTKEWISIRLRRPVSLLTELVEWFSSRLFFSAITPATPKIASRFPASKVAIIRNYPKLDELTNPYETPWSNRKLQVAYMGGIDIERGNIENLLALDLLDNPSVRMIMAGPFSSKSLEQECRSLKGWQQVDYHPWLSREKLMEELANSIAGLVVLHPTRAYLDSLPIKMFEYMLAGIPVVASDFSLWREILNENDCGILVDPLNPQETADAIQWIVEHPEQAEQMGKNGRKAVEEKYNWAQEEKKLFELYERLSA